MHELMGVGGGPTTARRIHKDTICDLKHPDFRRHRANGCGKSTLLRMIARLPCPAPAHHAGRCGGGDDPPGGVREKGVFSAPGAQRAQYGPFRALVTTGGTRIRNTPAVRKIRQGGGGAGPGAHVADRYR